MKNGIECEELVRQVERYSTNPDPLEHEVLLPLVRENFGPDAAEFFDRERRLPLLSDGGRPWPMTRGESTQMAFLGFVGAALAALGMAVLWSPRTLSAAAPR